MCLELVSDKAEDFLGANQLSAFSLFFFPTNVHCLLVILALPILLNTMFCSDPVSPAPLIQERTTWRCVSWVLRRRAWPGSVAPRSCPGSSRKSGSAVVASSTCGAPSRTSRPGPRTPRPCCRTCSSRTGLQTANSGPLLIIIFIVNPLVLIFAFCSELVQRSR